MQLIKHIIFVDIDDECKLIINSLNGTMDEINILALETISKWQQCDNISPSNESEMVLYNNLLNRGYLINNEDEEIAKKNEILDSLRRYHAHDRMKYRSLTFIMTYDCNFRCPYCFEGEANRKKEVMTPELIDSALNLVGDGLESVLLFGGEPLLPKTRPALEYLISKLPDVTFEIITNGYYLEEFIDLLATIKINYISVTIDGEEAHHNSKRFLANGNPTFKKILAGVAKCLEHGITTRVRMNVPKGSLDENFRLQDDLTKQFSMYKGLLSFEMCSMLDYSDEQKNAMLSEMFCSSVEYDYAERMKRNTTFGAMSPVINALTVGMPIRPLYSYCYAHENKPTVDPYGNLFTCLVTVGKDKLRSGTYHPTITYEENSITNRNIDKIPECRECIYSLLCGGGCPIRLKDHTDYFKPACSSIKNQIHDLLPRLYKAEQEHKKKAGSTQ